MKNTVRLLTISACVLALTSCSGTIIEVAKTTIPGPTTTTTLPIPTGDIPSLLEQLSTVTTGLGQLIVDGQSKEFKQRTAIADSIWVALEPQIRANGIDIVEDVDRIVGLIHTATERKRPADADKAERFLMLIRESADTLLNQ